MTPPNLTGSALAAWHRSEADRIEAEERARRPALAAGQVWSHPEYGETIIGEWGVCNSHELIAFSLFGQAPAYAGIVSLSDEWTYEGLARDVLRVVPPDPPAPQVAPEPTGAELVGRLCWFRGFNCGQEDPTKWFGPWECQVYDPNDKYGSVYRTVDVGELTGWYAEAKPYVEGVEP